MSIMITPCLRLLRLDVLPLCRADGRRGAENGRDDEPHKVAELLILNLVASEFQRIQLMKRVEREALSDEFGIIRAVDVLLPRPFQHLHALMHQEIEVEVVPLQFCRGNIVNVRVRLHPVGVHAVHHALDHDRARACEGIDDAVTTLALALFEQAADPCARESCRVSIPAVQRQLHVVLKRRAVLCFFNSV